MPIHEPGLDDVLARTSERMLFTLDVSEALDGAEFTFVAVGTPPTVSGDADLSAVWTVSTSCPRHAATLVMKSTVPAGTGEHIRAALGARGLDGVGYVSNPEFLAEGTGVHDFMQPGPYGRRRVRRGRWRRPRGAASGNRHPRRPLRRGERGDDQARRERVARPPGSASSTKSRTFASSSARTWRRLPAASVSTTGSALISCGQASAGEEAASRRTRSRSSNWPRTPATTSSCSTAVIEVNELQKRRIIQKLQRHTGKLRGKTIALLGLAFKPNTGDMREAPSLVLAARLVAEGAEVRAWDPIARPEIAGVEVYETPLEAVTGADAAVIVTEWPELAALASAEVRDAMRTPVLIDGRNVLDPEATRELGFVYEGVGRPEPVKVEH